jgi:hypothetical protein
MLWLRKREQPSLTIINTQEEFPWHVNHVELSLDMTQTESR